MSMNSRPEPEIEFSDTTGLLIVGSTTQLHDHARKASFELFRCNQREIEIVTFDELRRKIGLMIELLENVTK